MATVTKPIALDESFNTTEVTPRNIADVLAEGLSHITGRTASEVEYDNTDSGLTADNVQDALDEIAESVPTLPTTDIQTAVDEFETYNGGLLSSCKVALSPNQDLHGYDSPWVGGAGKNKLPLVLADIKSLNTSGTWSGNVYTINDGTITVNTDADGNVISIVGNGTFTAQSNLQLCGSANLINGTSYDLNGCPSGGSNSTFRLSFYNNAINAKSDTGSGVNFTYDSSGSNEQAYIRFYANYTANNVTFNPMIRLATESDPTFAPYSNICPISGHTQVEVGDDGKNLFDVNTYYSITSRITIADNKINFENSNYSPAIYHLDLKQGTYTFSTNVNLVSGSAYCKFRYLDEPSGNLGSISASTSGIQTVTFTVTRDETVYVEFCGASSTSTGSFANCQLELGSTATAYVPYNGYQITVNLGGTYYSGTLDVVSGVFTPDTAEKDLSTLTFRTASRNRWLSDSIISEVKHPSSSTLKIKFWSDSYYYTDAQNLYDDQTLIGIAVDNDGNILCRDNDANAPTGHIVYELATPTPIQLSPTMVKALVGENHLSAPLDGQEITESKYKQMFTFDDVIAYIQSLS